MPWWAHQWTEHSGGKSQWAWSYFSRNFESWNVNEKRTETQDRIFKNCGTLIECKYTYNGNIRREKGTKEIFKS